MTMDLTALYRSLQIESQPWITCCHQHALQVGNLTIIAKVYGHSKTFPKWLQQEHDKLLGIHRKSVFDQSLIDLLRHQRQKEEKRVIVHRICYTLLNMLCFKLFYFSDHISNEYQQIWKQKLCMMMLPKKLILVCFCL